MEATTTTMDRYRGYAIALAKAVAITLTFAGLYYLLCAWNPQLAKSMSQGVPFAKTIRLGTMLKAFVIVTPYAALGNALGSLWFNISQGDTVQYFMVYIQIGVGLAFWWLSKTIGRSTLKDLVVLGFYGVVNGAIAAMKLTAMAMLLQGSVWGKLMQSAVIWKVSVSALTLVGGYLLVLLFEAGMKAVRRGKGSTAQ